MATTRMNCDIQSKINILYDQGLTLKKIGEIVKFSQSTVSFQVSKEKKALRIKITESMKEEFRNLYDEGYVCAGIASQYGVSKSSVNRIVNFIDQKVSH